MPVTTQSIGCMLAGAIIGAKRGALSMLLFMLLVAIGFPLLSGGRGGLSVFIGPSGGFLLGWILGAYIIGFLFYHFSKGRFFYEFIFLFIGGILTVYALGIPWLVFIGKIPFDKAVMGSLVFIPGDLIKIIFTLYIVKIIKKSYPGFITIK